MLNKKITAGVLALTLLVGGAYAYNSSDSLQGRFGGTSLRNTSTTSTSKTTSSGTTTKPDFYMDGVISYDSGNNYFKVKVCQTNVTSSDVKQTSLKFAVSGGQSDTVQFTPTVAGSSATCQTVYSGDLLSELLIAQSGSYNITATVDSTSVQTEASESNNTLTTSAVATSSSYYLYDPANLPDLTVNDVSLEYYGTGSDVARPFALHPEICGIDDLISYPSNGAVKIYYVVSQNGTTLETGETELDDIFTIYGSCGTFTVPLDLDYGDVQSGTVTLNTQVDVMETTPESNENNNGFNQSFTDTVVVD